MESNQAAQDTAISGKLAKASNLSDLPNTAAARTNLGLGTAATQATGAFDAAGAAAAVQAASQPLDSDLTAIAALSTTTFGRSLLAQADAAATRTTLGTDAAGTARPPSFASPLAANTAITWIDGTYLTAIDEAGEITTSGTLSAAGALRGSSVAAGYVDSTLIGELGPLGEPALLVGGAGDVALYRNSSATPTARFTAPPTLPTYTTSSRPAAASVPAGSLIFVSDGAAGQKFQGSTGSAWVNLG